MLVLFDQGTPVPLARLLPEHEVRTAKQQGWDTLTNGELLRVAEEAGFELLLTTDKNIAYQQNLKSRKIAIVVLGRNRWTLVRRAAGRIAKAVGSAQPGGYIVVEVPDE